MKKKEKQMISFIILITKVKDINQAKPEIKTI